ncbi:MAG: peptidylprolyl isomerase [Pseudomonadota bacterium]
MAKKKSKGNQIAIYVIVGLICFAMIGFGATNFGGTITSIGKVGDRPIPAQRYMRELQGQIAQLSQQFGTPVTFQQAQVFGVDQQVLQQITATIALEAEALTNGISAGDEQVREQLLAIPAFQGLDGNFDREAYRFTLERSGETERDFEDALRAEIARTIVQGAVAGGVVAPQTYTSSVLNFIGERRNFSWVRLAEADLTDPIPTPGEADLQAYFDANPDSFMLPEARRITYAWVSPEMLVDQVDVNDEELRTLYEERDAEFNVPERRLVERLVLGAAAADAKARIDAGDLTFEALVEERGLTLADIDLGDVTEADLDAAGEAVFGADVGVVGPVDTNLGPALFRVNAILAAQSTSFEEARPVLVEEYGMEVAADLISGQVETIDDLLAGGATLEELAADTDMELGEIEWSADMRDGIAQYDTFRRAAAEAEPRDFPEVLELSDGGLLALRIEEVIAPRLPEFADVRADAEDGWRREAVIDALMAQAETAEACCPRQHA